MNEQNLTPFRKGQSGNPAGRPKGVRNRSTVLRKWLECEVPTRALPADVRATLGKLFPKHPISCEDAITLSMIHQAMNGNVAAYKALSEFCYGKPVQTIEAGPEPSKDISEMTIEEIDAELARLDEIDFSDN